MHPVAGKVHYASLALMFVSLVVLSLLRWPASTHLVIIGSVTFAVSVRARRRRRHGWLRVHTIAMGTSYIGLLTGFYVDNGLNLPLWRDLPHATYWVLPALIGVPILLVALHRNTRPVTAR